MIVHVFGTSGFARETRDVASAMRWETVFVASNAAERDSFTGNERVIREADLPTDARCSIGIGDNALRAKIAHQYRNSHEFINLIHPSATFGEAQRDTVNRATGVIICAGVRFTNNIAVGDFSIFNLNATIGHDADIGDFANLAPGANISGYVTVGRGVWVGTNAAINQGREGANLVVGDYAVIGSGSVVVRACEARSTYVGIPARMR